MCDFLNMIFMNYQESFLECATVLTGSKQQNLLLNMAL